MAVKYKWYLYLSNINNKLLISRSLKLHSEKLFFKQSREKDYPSWNAFIGQAKNATFLFHRDFMEYHKDRFEDYSLMIFDNEKLVAVLPANKVGDVVFSHQG